MSEENKIPIQPPCDIGELDEEEANELYAEAMQLAQEANDSAHASLSLLERLTNSVRGVLSR